MSSNWYSDLDDKTKIRRSFACVEFSLPHVCLFVFLFLIFFICENFLSYFSYSLCSYTNLKPPSSQQLNTARKLAKSSLSQTQAWNWKMILHEFYMATKQLSWAEIENLFKLGWTFLLIFPELFQNNSFFRAPLKLSLKKKIVLCLNLFSFEIITTWKVAKFEVFLDRVFLVFSTSTGKYRPEKLRREPVKFSLKNEFVLYLNIFSAQIITP